MNTPPRTANVGVDRDDATLSFIKGRTHAQPRRGTGKRPPERRRR